MFSEVIDFLLPLLCQCLCFYSVLGGFTIFLSFFSQELKTHKKIARTIFHSVIAFRFETMCKTIPCKTLAVDNQMKV